jgi:hypothetical protein
MNKYIYYCSCLLLAALLICSCKKGGVKGFKVDNFSNGKAGEVILILDKKFTSESTQKYIEEVLTQPQPALPQVEPMFDLLHFENKNFTSYFQRHRSIVQFDVNPNYSTNSFNIENNVWTRPQVHLYFKGNSMDSLFLLFMQNENEIIKTLYDNDLKRVQCFTASNNNP